MNQPETQPEGTAIPLSEWARTGVMVDDVHWPLNHFTLMKWARDSKDGGAIDPKTGERFILPTQGRRPKYVDADTLRAFIRRKNAKPGRLTEEDDDVGAFLRTRLKL